MNEPIPDIRDIAAPDAGERVDPKQRHRVPLRHETAATVDRAQLALAEIKARHAAETAEAARAAAIEPDGDERRDELNRWADQDLAEADTRHIGVALDLGGAEDDTYRA